MTTTTGLLPHARSRDSRGKGIAPVRGNGAETLHFALFILGALLLPLGLIVIGLGWYGVAHTPYQYDQTAYLVSGGLGGLGLTFVGGFLYFGSWLARMVADQKEASIRLGDTLLILADAVANSGSGHSGATRDVGAILVTAGAGATVHRADCDLVRGREDLSPAGPDAAGLAPCRICLPSH